MTNNSSQRSHYPYLTLLSSLPPPPVAAPASSSNPPSSLTPSFSAPSISSPIIPTGDSNGSNPSKKRKFDSIDSDEESAASDDYTSDSGSEGELETDDEHSEEAEAIIERLETLKRELGEIILKLRQENWRLEENGPSS